MNLFYGKHHITEGFVWNSDSETFDIKDSEFLFQLEWERRFLEIWSELTPLEQSKIELVASPFTEESVVAFLDVLKSVKAKRGAFHSVVSWFSAESKNVNFPTPAVDVEHALKNILLPWMIEIPKGSFVMGNSDIGMYSAELTKTYAIGKNPVTQRLWEDVLGDNPSRFKDLLRPVEQVRWMDCICFCNALSDRDELPHAYIVAEDEVIWNDESTGYRLPTEAEWEYAARANSDFKYSGGNILDEVGWYKENCPRQSRPVGRKKANDWGLHDMSGNVSEWCWDWEGDYPDSKRTDPKGPEFGTNRIIRGGSWYAGERYALIDQRRSLFPQYSSNHLGFRLCRNLD